MVSDNETIVGYPLNLRILCGTRTFNVKIRNRQNVISMHSVQTFKSDDEETEAAQIAINAYAPLIMSKALSQKHVLKRYHEVDGETEISFIHGEKMNEQDRQEQIDRVTHLLPSQQIRFTIGPLYCCLEASERNLYEFLQ